MAKKGKFSLSSDRKSALYEKLETQKPRKGETLPTYNEFVFGDGVAEGFLSARANVKKTHKESAVIKKISSKASSAIAENQRKKKEALGY